MGLPRRSFGHSGPDLSVLTLGTMRLPEMVDDQPIARFLLDLAEQGVDTHHSSLEYETDGRYCAALADARKSGAEFRHVVKVAEPSWDDVAFDATRFRRAIDAECRRLGTDHLAVVQWMIRTKTPTDDSVRLPILQRDWDVIADAFTQARQQGQVGAVAVFGYTEAFTAACIDGGLVDGVTSYLNPYETEAEARAQTVPTLAIRPFAGGKAFEDPTRDALPASRTVEELICYPFRAAATVSVIASFSSRHHADQLIGALSGGSYGHSA